MALLNVQTNPPLISAAPADVLHGALVSSAAARPLLAWLLADPACMQDNAKGAALV